MTQETKLFVGIAAVTVAIVVGAATLFSNPAKPIAQSELIAGDSPKHGPDNAKTWLVEFSDFQCPACKLFSSEVDALAKKYPDRLLVAYRYYPLPQHQYAVQAAAAAEAAEKQGKFWEMGDLLFAGQDSLSDASVASMASALELDQKQFDVDWKSAAVKAKIDKDVAYGESIGINVTPTFFLNGVKLEPQSVDELRVKVEEALAANK